jgi:hypothetical protein
MDQSPLVEVTEPLLNAPRYLDLPCLAPPMDLLLFSSNRKLQVRCRFAKFAIPWDPGESFFNPRRLLQHHLSIVGVRHPASSPVPASTDALRGQSTQVFASPTPLRSSVGNLVSSDSGIFVASYDSSS